MLFPLGQIISLPDIFTKIQLVVKKTKACGLEFLRNMFWKLFLLCKDNTTEFHKVCFRQESVCQRIKLVNKSMD